MNAILNMSVEKNTYTFEGVLTNEQTNLLYLVTQGLGLSHEDTVHIEIPLTGNGQIDGMSNTSIGQVMSTIHQVFHFVDNPPVGKEARERLRKPIRQMRAEEIHNPSGARQIREENYGVVHSVPSYSRNGRNHSGKVRAGR